MVIIACIMLFSAFNIGLPMAEAFVYAGKGMLGIGIPIAMFTYLKWVFRNYFQAK